MTVLITDKGENYLAQLGVLNLKIKRSQQENKRFYYMYLQKAQSEGNISQLEDFMCDAVIDAFELLEEDQKYK